MTAATLTKTPPKTVATAPEIDPALRAEFVMLTPELALEWLDHMPLNRSVSDGKEKAYARDMGHGDWRMTGEAIKFSREKCCRKKDCPGRLLDGQHRCLAVIDSEVSVPVLVVYGLDDATQRVMDSGVARTAGNNLSMDGEVHANMLAAAARIALDIEATPEPRAGAHSTPSHSEIYRWLDDHPLIRESAAHTMTAPAVYVKMPPSLRAYAHYRLAQVDDEKANQFFDGLGDLLEVPAGSPIRALYRRLDTLREDRVKVAAFDYLHMTFRAWNKWRNEETMAVIPLVSARGRTPLPPLR